MAEVSEFHWSDKEGVTVVSMDGARFRCGLRAPGDTGPVIETLLEQSTTRPIMQANLVGGNHVAVRWRTETVEQAIDSQLAQNR